MKNRLPKTLFFSILWLSLLLAGCGPEKPAAPILLTPPAMTVSPPAASTRSFLLGIHPFPHAMTDEAVEESYRFASQHADLFLYHLDGGVPWPEAFAGELYHPNVMANIAELRQHRQPGQKLYLAITPNDTERNLLARYWGEAEKMQLPAAWREKTFDDPDVIAAYLNHARFMIGRLEPDYFAYGIEVTCGFTGVDDPALAQFQVFAREVYTTLKREYPDLHRQFQDR